MEPLVDPLLPVIAGGIVSFAAAIGLRRDPTAIVSAVRGAMFPVLFVALPLCFLISLRSSGEDGKMLLLLLVVVMPSPA